MLSTMALMFDAVRCSPIQQFSALVPDGACVGVVGFRDSGARQLLKLAAGAVEPESGIVTAPQRRCYLTPGASSWSPAELIVVDSVLDMLDPVEGFELIWHIEQCRRSGSTVLLATRYLDRIQDYCDEAWWIDEGRLRMRACPAEVIAAFQREASRRIRALGEKLAAPLAPQFRRGDGRAELVAIELLGEDGTPSFVWRSGERVTVKVRVRFHAPVADPVVGIMIRTRLGFEVYGTNTELEGVKLGSCQAGDVRDIEFTFACELCPQGYTITAASHDPDGVWHDWLEDAIAFSVTDTRYTAGVARLRAAVKA